jgi:uncharacterized protein (TIGR00297 family)
VIRADGLATEVRRVLARMSTGRALVAVSLVGGGSLCAASLVDPTRLAGLASELLCSLAWTAGKMAILATAAYLAGGVSASGAVAGWMLAVLLFGFGGWRALAILAVLVALGTACTKVGYARKAAAGIAERRGGRRGACNVIAKGLPGVIFAFLAAATPFRDAFTLAMVAALATGASDTVASELGQVFGRRHVLVTSFRSVPAGTDGAVSLEGTLAGILTSVIVSVVASWIGLIPLTAAWIAVAAAFVGTTADSCLGATLERRHMLDGGLVNFASTVTGALVAILLSWPR